MRKAIATIVLAILLLALVTVVASAISNGEPDAGRHPYVALITDGEWACSASAISDTVLVTAAHCLTKSTIAATFSEAGDGPWVSGTIYRDPEWCILCGPNYGLPNFDTHDVAVVVLDRPVELARYASLPSPGLVDTLANKTDVDLVGYGAQFSSGGGPRIPYDGVFTRYFASTELVASNHAHAEEYIKLASNPSQGTGGFCFGDSGGPDLLAGTDTILAVNSYLTNNNCSGVTYSNRIDTESALGFIHIYYP